LLRLFFTKPTRQFGQEIGFPDHLLPFCVNACVILRRNNFDPPFAIALLLSTVDNLQGSLFRLFCHSEERYSHPTLRQVISIWTLCGGWLAPRRANEGYTAGTAACARLVCQAYHRCPDRMTCRPLQCLNSLTPDARRGGPLHPRPRRWCVSSGGYLDFCELPTMDSCHPDHWVGTSIFVSYPRWTLVIQTTGWVPRFL
jgi:hypothetical protein